MSDDCLNGSLKEVSGLDAMSTMETAPTETAKLEETNEVTATMEEICE